MPPDIDSDIPGRSVGNAAISSMQVPHTPRSVTVARPAPRRDSSTASSAAPTANEVSEAASSHPFGWNAYSLIMPCSGSRPEVTCSAVMAAPPAVRAARPPAVKGVVMHPTVPSGLVRGHREIVRNDPWSVPEATPARDRRGGSRPRGHGSGSAPLSSANDAGAPRIRVPSGHRPP
ncbi:hypothetical protein Sme01_20770 [Sphaerisporangium melleum]|uniref:Uncharacterized protein n=1 Tax=Sphaerisporangium melleum TaxID=321316 RepID=A0A917VFW6_9ACTN|nr:hypothetical protein [Sphaerisporangium melleum]GGK76554.1 hypothetical protein GCM10007964_19180 [Sphaerisporangium melleum]GII69601.1 hypothetical protein Sme01_20770 [Sphaerisporangium melleum]